MPSKKPNKTRGTSKRRVRPKATKPLPMPPKARRQPRPGTACPVVGIGASAGGLDAFNQLFNAMPAKSGAAFVLIQHLDPTHESLTAELLGRHTPMSVVQVSRTMAIEPDHVYVIPPNKYLGISDGKLRLTMPMERRGLRMPVDFFLRSLAQERRERAIGIILSGSGTDGTLGLKEVKAGGGLTAVQDPKTAQYDGMPRSAIASGSVDYILPVSRIPEILTRYISHSYVRQATEEELPAEKAPESLTAIIAILRARAKFDFTCYKRGTLVRRIQRRMSVRHVDQIGEYVRFLRREPAEASALFRDLLINVTSFFREPDSWDAFRELAVKRLLTGKEPDSPIRVWVPACASGEEAYSAAILMIEELRAAKRNCALQVFASDVDVEALEVARSGLYPESIAADVSPERLRRFFIKGDNHYRVNRELRESVTIAAQNLIADPPFSRLDLICCRNLLIYLDNDVQRRIISLLHFALNEGGFLFLGSAESVVAQDDLFETLSKKWRIYRRIGPTRHDRVQFRVLREQDRGRPVEAATQTPVAPHRIATAVQQFLLERFAPACVIITRKYEILYFSGATHDYLSQPAGPPTHHLLTIAREGLQGKLRTAVHQAIQTDRAVAVNDVRVKRGKTLHAIPLDGGAPERIQGH